MSPAERVFIIGGTGNIGTKVVQDLLDNDPAVTLYARTPSNVDSLFPANKGLVNVVQGEYSDLSPFKAGIKGHTRLFLLITDTKNMVKLKTEIAKAAFEAGVKQIVDISSTTVNLGWRTSFIGGFQYASEKAKLIFPIVVILSIFVLVPSCQICSIPIVHYIVARFLILPIAIILKAGFPPTILVLLLL